MEGKEWTEGIAARHFEESSDGRYIREEGGSYDYLSNSASAADCTGLIYKPVEREDELLAYDEVYDFLPPGEDKKTAFE